MDDTNQDEKKSVSIARDYMALDRTELANERTLLAYIRTGLIFLATGLTFIKVFTGDPVMQIIGWIMMTMSIPVFIFGFYRFFSIRKHLSKTYSKE